MSNQYNYSCLAKCAGSGASGDVIDFTRRLKNIDPKEAIKVTAKSTDTRLSIDVQQCQQICKHATDCVPLFDDYFTGCRYLCENISIAHEIDKWRGWPNFTTSTLAENCLISITNKSVAFGEYEPYAGTTNETSMRLVGYHARMWLDNPIRDDWKYVPSARESCYSIVERQCVPGSICVSQAKYSAILRHGMVRYV